MGYIFLIIFLFCGIFMLVELAKTQIGGLICVIIGILLLIKFMKFIKKDHKHWFRVTKRSIILSILTIFATLFVSDVMFASSSSLSRNIIYILGFIIVIGLQVNKSYSHDKKEEAYQISKSEFEEEIEKMKENGTYEQWLVEQNKLWDKYHELEQAIKEFKQSEDRKFQLEWINEYGDLIHIKSNRKGDIFTINDIYDQDLRLDIIEYAKEHLCVEGISIIFCKYLQGNIKKAKIGLPIKIVKVYNSVFLKKFFYEDISRVKSLVVEISYHVFHANKVNIICTKEDYEQKKVVIVDSKKVLSDIKQDDERIGSYDGNYGKVCFYDNFVLGIDYRH